jgi:hypothetical protein
MVPWTTVKLNTTICDRARKAAKSAGYSSLEEFIEHAVEKELANHPDPASSVSNDELRRKLKGLGYI